MSSKAVNRYKTQSFDTSIEVEVLQFHGFRRFPLSKRAEIISSVTQGCLEMCLVGIRQQYPNARPAKVRQELARRTLDPKLAALICSHEDEEQLALTDPIGLALQIASTLESLGIPYVIGDSLASSLWGEPRSTDDIDPVADLRPEQVQLLVDAVQSDFYVSEEAVRDAIAYRSSFNLLRLDTMSKVDIFVLKDQAFPQSKFARRRAAIVRQNPEQSLILPSPEDIILQKLTWYQMGGGVSDKQWRDVLGVMKLQGERLDFEYLWQWATTLNLTELLDAALGEAELA